MVVKIKNSITPMVSVVIPVMNERRTLAAVIQQARRVHHATEVIVIANGSTDGSRDIAQRMGARVISFDRPLGHDVGRSIGAAEARGKYLLFTDGDIAIATWQLTPFIRALDKGVDIALNQYSGFVRKNTVHNVVLAKHALNTCLSYPKLKGASLTAIPHAMKRETMLRIGIENLAVPPKAQTIAAWLGMNIRAVQYVNVGTTNPRRRRKFRKDPLERLIVGDHLEAIHWYLQKTNARGYRTDLNRMRELLEGIEGGKCDEEENFE